MFHWQNLRLYGRLAATLGLKGAVDWRKAKRSGGVVRTPLSQYPMHVRARTSDADVFHQIFVEREYRCIDGLSPRTIVDAGANVGFSSAYFLTRFPDARVIALEPDPGNFRALECNLAPWADRVILHNAALWSEPTTLNFNVDTTGKGEEWGRQVEPASGPGDIVATSIPALAAGPIDLLKVDIEGAEKTVFGGDPSWLSQVRNIVIELHSDEDRRVFFDAIRDIGYSVSQCAELTVCLSQ